MSIIKEIGNSSINSIEEEREKALFKRYEDTIKRLSNIISIEISERLNKCISLNSFKVHLTTMFQNLDSLIKYSRKIVFL